MSVKAKLKKTPVFCGHCFYCREEKRPYFFGLFNETVYNCIHPDNTETAISWLVPYIEGYKKTPQEMNANNDCSNFASPPSKGDTFGKVMIIE